MENLIDYLLFIDFHILFQFYEQYFNIVSQKVFIFVKHV